MAYQIKTYRRGLSDYEDEGQPWVNYYDEASGYWFDEYGNGWDVIGGGGGAGDRYDENGDLILDTIYTFEQGVPIAPDGEVLLSDLQATFDWWRSINGDTAPLELPAITYNAGYILNNSATTLANDPQAPQVIKLPTNGAKIKKFLESLVKSKTGGAGSGGGSGSSGGAGAQNKPAAVAPNAQGACPIGYTKTAAGKCALNKKSSSAWGDFLSNPLLVLAALAAALYIVKGK